jgi:hypothetical protein
MGLIILQPHCCSDISAAVPIDETTSGPISCPKCRKPIGMLVSNAGYVYVLSSTAFPGTFKVGFTNRDVNERVEELNNSTSLPSPFVVEMIFLSVSAREDEVSSHASLSHYRINDRREFFKISLEKLHDHLVCILRRKPIFVSESLCNFLAFQQQLEQKRQQEELKRKRQSILQSTKTRKCAVCGHISDISTDAPNICPRCRAICFS